MSEEKGGRQERETRHGLTVLRARGLTWGNCACGWVSPSYLSRWPMPVQLAFGVHLQYPERVS